MASEKKKSQFYHTKIIVVWNAVVRDEMEHTHIKMLLKRNFWQERWLKKKFIGKIIIVLWQQKTYEEEEKRKEKLWANWRLLWVIIKTIILQ